MSSDVENRKRCKRHPKEPAGWHCDTCKADICATCTARLLTLFYCCECSQKVNQLTVPRSQIPFFTRVFEAITYPVRGGLKWLIPAAILLSLVTSVVAKAIDPEIVTPGLPPSAFVIPPLRALLVLLFLFVIVVSTARRGRTEHGVFLITVKFLAALLILLAPAVVYFVLVRRAPPDLSLIHDKMMWLLGGLCVMYVPVAMAGGAADASFLEVLNPFKVFDWAGRVGKRYIATVGALAVLTCAAAGLAVSAARIQSSVHTPFIGGVLAEMVALCLMAAMARLVGTLLYVHGDAFDWGSEADYQDPILVGVDAKGTFKVARPTGTDAAGAPVAGAPALGAGVPREKTEKELAKQVHNALLDDNVPRAIRLYLARPAWDPKLFDQNQLFVMGTAAIRVKNFAGAVRLLTGASEAKGPNASRALVALGQVHAEGFNDAAKAAEMYRSVIEKYPTSDAAKLAAQRLKEATPS